MYSFTCLLLVVLSAVCLLAACCLWLVASGSGSIIRKAYDGTTYNCFDWMSKCAYGALSRAPSFLRQSYLKNIP